VSWASSSMWLVKSRRSGRSRSSLPGAETTFRLVWNRRSQAVPRMFGSATNWCRSEPPLRRRQGAEEGGAIRDPRRPQPPLHQHDALAGLPVAGHHRGRNRWQCIDGAARRLTRLGLRRTASPGSANGVSVSRETTVQARRLGRRMRKIPRLNAPETFSEIQKAWNPRASGGGT
jgi:hypothetical protein